MSEEGAHRLGVGWTIYVQVQGKVQVGHGPYLHKYTWGTTIPREEYMLICNMMCVCFGSVCLIDS